MSRSRGLRIGTAGLPWSLNSPCAQRKKDMSTARTFLRVRGAASLQRSGRLADALDELGVGETDLDAEEPTTVMTSHGELRVIPVPAGTRGYDDLRRAAIREPIGHGLRPAVASKGDLARMLSALGRDEDAEKLRQLRQLIELEHELGMGIEL